jgi:ribosomal protein S12 methylthiotransferase accessory factor
LGIVAAVVGEGVIAEFVCKELSVDYKIVRLADFKTEVLKEAELVLVVLDKWIPSFYLQAEELLQRAGIPWLGGFVAFNEGIVGPLVRPGVPGCSQCADTRRLMAGRDREDVLERQLKLFLPGGAAEEPQVSRIALLQVAYLLAEEARRVLSGSRTHSEGRVYLIDLNTLQSSLHVVLPDPLCSVCGRLPDDCSAAAGITLQPSPKIAAGSFRCKTIEDLKNVLANDYLDSRTGLMNDTMVNIHSPFADVIVNLPSFIGNELTAGRTFSYEESKVTAILEGLERHCGLLPRGKRTVVHGSYRHLSEQALDPLTVGVYTKEQYALPDFPFEPFDPDKSINWVWGYSFLQRRPLLIPELLAYYSLGSGGSFVHETSNGCAVGGSLEEAIFYGILEVIERDSFLMTWYGMLPIPRIDACSLPDTQLRLMVDRMQAVAGYEVLLFNSTMEHGIPSVWAIAKNRRAEGMNLICAAGAHLDPVRAAKSAIHELGGILLVQDGELEENRDDYAQMLLDPFLVRQMEDHAMLYGLPEAEQRLQFLLNGDRPVQTFDGSFKRKGSEHPDLTEDLRDILTELGRLNLDVIVIDQTTPETIRNGLHCVKVLIPGMLPMTFGHHLVRLAGLDRVLTVPAKLQYAQRPLTYEQLNPHPHPFP